MTIALCQTVVDSSGRELINHGTVEYPVSCCHDDLGVNYVPWHWHQELEAVRVDEGTAIVAAGDEKYIVRAGEGFFINSSVLHACWDYEHSSCRFHSIVFHPGLVSGNEQSVFHEKYVDVVVNARSLSFAFFDPQQQWQAQALDCIEKTWQANRQESRFFEIETRNQLSLLLALLGENCKDSIQHSGRTLRQSERMKIMMQYIKNNLDGRISVADIAASASISESECLRCFRNSIHTTPMQYLRSCRIQRAAELLRGTQEKIHVVAHMCGFEDISYFTKIFHQLKGMTPSQYRDKI